MKFRTQYKDAHEKHYYCPEGEKVEIRHSAHIDTNGRRFLAKDKPVDIFHLIQSHKEECEIENIIRRAVEGDYLALNKTNGRYEDITNCPSSIAEAQQFIIDQKEAFKTLPKDIKAKFEYNAEIYIAEMGNNPDSWLEKMGFTEKWAKEEELKAASNLTKENFEKAMSNLAQGTTLSNEGETTNE